MVEVRVRVPVLQAVIDDLRARAVYSDDPKLGADLDMDGHDLIDANGNELLAFNKTASAVNHPAVTNAVTGSPPLVSAAGDDTNIDLLLLGKGTGQVRISSAIGAVGDRLVTPAGLELLRLTTVSSAVNEYAFTNSATGNDPTLTATGGDTNIGLTITPKGTGRTTITDAWEICTAGTRPGHVAGKWIYETDTEKSRQSNGTEWLEWNDGDAWDTYTPTLGGWVLNNGTLEGHYRLRGYTMDYRVQLLVGSTTTFGGLLKFDVPSGMKVLDTTQQFIPVAAGGWDSGSNLFVDGGAMVAGASGENVASRFSFAGVPISATVPFTWATGDYVFVAGTLEMEDVNAPTS